MMGERSKSEGLFYDRILDAVRHGFWMRKVRVVASRICRGGGGFGVALGCGVVFALGFAPWVRRYFRSGMRGFWVEVVAHIGCTGIQGLPHTRK